MPYANAAARPALRTQPRLVPHAPQNRVPRSNGVWHLPHAVSGKGAVDTKPLCDTARVAGERELDPGAAAVKAEPPTGLLAAPRAAAGAGCGDGDECDCAPRVPLPPPPPPLVVLLRASPFPPPAGDVAAARATDGAVADLATGVTSRR